MYKTTASVEGMRCGMCESHVNDVIRRNFDVVSVNASHVKNNVVIVTHEPIDEFKLRSAVGEEGYIIGNVTTEPYEKKSFWARLFKK